MEMKRIARHRSILVAAMIAAGASACADPGSDGSEDGPGEASGAVESLSAEDQAGYASASAHAATGKLTKADEQWLTAHPEIAAGIPDPTQTEHGEIVEAEGDESIFGESAKTDKAVAAADAKATCRITNRYQKVYGNIHDHLFDYHTRVGWCYDGKKVTKINFSYAYFDDIDSWIQVNSDDTLKKMTKLSSSQYQTDNKGKASYCILKYGCTDTYYPHNRVTVDAKGNTSLWWDN